jgi:hypothetical protein
MTKHQKIVALRTALRNGTPLEYRYTDIQWVPAATNTTSADIKRHPELYRIKS